jgi:putative phage-type endonuclease
MCAAKRPRAESAAARPPPLDARRANDVTASDVPSICGENPFSSRRQVLFSKTFKIPFEGSEATRWGQKYEPVAIEKFCAASGAKVSYPGYRKHAKYPWLGGTIDGLLTMPDGSQAILEVKCPFSRSFKEGSEIPAHYLGQVQCYLEIYDMEVCQFIQYKPRGIRTEEKLTVTVVPRDRSYMELRLPRLYDFWREMSIWMVQTERVIVIIQRAWRAYLAKKKVNEAAKQSFVARLRCARMIGKIAGFIKRSEINAAFNYAFSAATTIVAEIGSFPLASAGFFGGRKPSKDNNQIYLAF